MPLATLSPESIINRELESLGCGVSTFANICQVVSPSRMAVGLNGDRNFEHHDAQKMLLWLREMKELTEFSPTPVSWKEVEQIRSVLEQRRQVRTLVQQVQNVFDEYTRIVRSEHGG